jgi:hypothetical protein
MSFNFCCKGSSLTDSRVGFLCVGVEVRFLVGLLAIFNYRSNCGSPRGKRLPLLYALHFPERHLSDGGIHTLNAQFLRISIWTRQKDQICGRNSKPPSESYLGASSGANTLSTLEIKRMRVLRGSPIRIRYAGHPIIRVDRIVCGGLLASGTT